MSPRAEEVIGVGELLLHRGRRDYGGPGPPHSCSVLLREVVTVRVREEDVIRGVPFGDPGRIDVDLRPVAADPDRGAG